MKVNPITFRKAEKQDIPRVSEFRKNHFETNLFRSCEAAYYEWKCFSNPFQQGEIWLAEDGNNIAAIRAMTPRRIKVPGGVFNAVEMGDGFTRSDYQRRGIFTGITEAVKQSILDRGISLFYGSPNKNSLPGMKKMNFLQVPMELRSLAKPFRIENILAARWHNSTLAKLFSPFIELIGNLATRFGTAGADKDLTISKVSSFPDDIDTFWERACQSYDVTLVRNREYLEWRYVKNPDHYSIFIATDKSGSTVGYMVTKICPSEKEVTGFIVDFLTLGNGPKVFKSLLANAIKEFNHNKLNVAHVWSVNGSSYDKVFIRTGFLPRENVPLLFYPSELGNMIIKNPYNWHFTMGDKDIV